MLQHGVGRKQGQQVANLLQSFIGPLEQWLDRQVDRRLVRTFSLALAAMMRLRHSRSGLLLSELGAHILSPSQAPAGTKRLSNLLRSPKWSHALLEKFLWRRAEEDPSIISPDLAHSHLLPNAIALCQGSYLPGVVPSMILSGK